MNVFRRGLLVMLVCQSACVVVDGSPGGDRATRTSEPGDFESIVVLGGFERVEIEVCGECRPLVKVEGDDRQVDEVIVNTDDGELELRHRSRLVVTDIDLAATIRVPNLVAARNSGSADITIRNVATSRFDVVNEGSGDVTVAGNAEALDLNAAGSGDIAAFDLEAQDVDVTLSGSGDAEVCATGELRARTAGSGDVFYDCNPAATDFDSTGSGRISVR